MRIQTRLAALAGVTVLTFGVAGSALAGSFGLGGGGASGPFIDQHCGVEPLDVQLIIDSSGSMEDNSSNGKTRLEWAQLSAKQLIASLDANGGVGDSGEHRVGVSTFQGSSAWVVVSLGDAATAAELGTSIDGLDGDGNTPLELGMDAGADDMNAFARGGAQQILIILSDGRPWLDQGPDGDWADDSNGRRPTEAEGNAYLGSADVRISVAIGEGGDDDPYLVDLGLMALLGPDGSYHVTDAGDLPDVFADIYIQITCPTEPPVTEPPVTEPPVTEPPVTEPPVTEPPVTEPPVATPSFEQSVAAETDTPTQPPTSMVGGGTSGPADGAWMLVIVLGVILASLVAMTAAPARSRR
jgi:hypothetical protein